MFYFKRLQARPARLCWLSGCFILLNLLSMPLLADIVERINEAEKLRISGHLPQALHTLVQIQESLPARSQNHTLVMGLIANIYQQQRKLDEAYLILSETQPYAEAQGWQLIASDQSLMLANLYIQKNNPQQARQALSRTLQIAQENQDYKSAIQAHISLTRLQLKQDLAQAASALGELAQYINRFPEALTPELRLNWVQLLLENGSPDFVEDAFVQLEAVLKTPQVSDFNLSQAYGLMAQLYRNAGRNKESVTLLNKAIFAAQTIPELLFRWEWQLGDALQSLQNIEDAIAALRRAVIHVEAIRQDIPVDYIDGRSSFRATLEPLYLQLTDLLLLQARATSNTKLKQALLLDARATIELLKRSELEDYFDNRCVIENQREIDLTNIAQNSAAIYPIMLPDRLEILVTLGDQIVQRTVPVPAELVAQSAKHLASKFRSLSPEYQPLSRQFYQWLITPVESILRDHNVDTLIYLPDGALRLVPIASLHNGQQFLIEQYGVVTSPGLTLF